ncbi:MAG: TldD/PmbA family protein [Notoacmeibacter sp.]|nr:TldD/PmbA family protein [Notoacmeibacter sp.]MCC0032566.1 TldD/PmbA family protein [Brucellaceae bacterium]
MPDTRDTDKLEERVSRLVEAAVKAGADAADAVVVRSGSTSVSVRLGKVENTESSVSDDVSLRVFVGARSASVSATTGYDPVRLAERAVAMAKASPEDRLNTLADPANLARSFPDLDLFDPFEPDAAAMTETALQMEAAALDVPGVTNSGGAGVSAGYGGLVLATSHGFVGSYVASRFSRSVSVLAGEGTAMERDYEYSSALHHGDLRDALAIGLEAGERTVARLGAQKLKTGPVEVVFDPRVARGLAASLASAINGGSVARKTSFLRDRMGKQVANAAVTVTDDPLRRRGSSSRPFDGEGVQGTPLTMIGAGVLNHWTLSTSAARELGLETNGRGVRSASSVNPSSTNFAIEPGGSDPADMISSISHGIYVTELIGQGVNMVTGDYSRGASGFRIENGKLGGPVSGVTLAGNLKGMFLSMQPANDLDRSFGTASPTLFMGRMMLAGD